MRLITTLLLALSVTACAAADEAEGWNTDNIDSHESELTRRVAADEPAAVVADGSGEIVLAEIEPVREEPRDGEEPGGEEPPVCGKKIATRIHFSEGHVSVEWNDGSSSEYCLNAETGQYVAC